MQPSQTRFGRRRRFELLLFFLLLIATLLVFGPSPRTHLEEVLKKGELTVVTRNSPTTYYIGPDGPTGPEYDLALAFAEHLGVELELITPQQFSDIIPAIAHGDADLAAAGLTVTESRARQVRFAPPYQTITQQLVYRSGRTPRPASLEDLDGSIIDVVAGSSHEELLQELLLDTPSFEIKPHLATESEELLYLVWEGFMDYTVADSNEVTLNQRFYPELAVAFDVSEPQPLAWAFPPGEDESLYNAAVAFFEQIREDGRLQQILERHYGHAERLDYVGTRVYLRHIARRLPKYRPLFEEAAEKHDIDWRLLAAIGYQESHWNPLARSPTGVRGLMMLTQRTARQMSVENRLDPEESIMGGARYFMHVKERLPERIQEPDRTWMALAAYNVGLGHLEDARKITEYQGGDPDKWIDVMARLPLLSQKAYYKYTRYGYARGREPVKYVQNIRSYYDILVWVTSDRDSTRQPASMDPVYSIVPPSL